MNAESNTGKLEKLVQLAKDAREVGKREDWNQATAYLNRAQHKLISVLRLVELANDVQRVKLR